MAVKKYSDESLEKMETMRDHDLMMFKTEADVSLKYASGKLDHLVDYIESLNSIEHFRMRR